MRTPRLPVVDRFDAPADFNGLVRFAERPNVVSARVPSLFRRSVPYRVPWWESALAAMCKVCPHYYDCLLFYLVLSKCGRFHEPEERYLLVTWSRWLDRKMAR